jgi:uncharacterized protein YciI
MAKFAAVLTYIPDAGRVSEIRPSHREYLSGLLKAGKLYRSGPFPDGSGALIVYEAEDLAEAQVLLANDPFSKNGVINGVTLKEWNVVMGEE